MTAATQTLTEFLLARIAEDEARAKSSYRVTTHDLAVRDMGDWIEVDGESMRPAEYLERFCEPNPDARVLADAEAKRRIVEAHPRSLSLDYCETCFSGDYGRLDDPLHEDWPCPTLRALAAVYADHPDYREEWKP